MRNVHCGRVQLCSERQLRRQRWRRGHWRRAEQLHADRQFNVQSGGGVYASALNNCTLATNTANAANGGGASASTLNNCALNGNSAANGGGVDSSFVNNSALAGNSASSGGAANQGTLSNCTLSNNSAAYYGGATYNSALFNCVLSGNFASGDGGGTAFGFANNCVLSGNSAGDSGGAAYGSALDDCLLSSNSAANLGGGTLFGDLDNCTLTGNSVASGSGGGAYVATLGNCSLSGNSAFTSGGGVEGSTLNNCTLTGNSAATGGGADSSTLNNCIVYYNSAPSGTNSSGSTLNFCCTTPLPGNGTNNITAEPQLADATHISANSPCIGAGSTNYSTGVDIDGEPWARPPSIGCDEYYSGAITGALSVAILADYTNVASSFAVDFTAQIGGHASANMWNFGDGTVVSNCPYVSHSWGVAGDYVVVLTAYNETYPDGLSATITIHVVVQPVYYVALINTNPVAPYTSWATAATNIQDAVEVAIAGGTVLVSNGVYGTGGRVLYGAMTNRVTITRSVTVTSVNGPAATVIQGNPIAANAVRCVYLANGAALAGFTLTNGTTRNDGDTEFEQSGGGIWCESAGAKVSNCVISGNSAAASGGGVFRSTLNNCVISGNSAATSGGGVFQGTLNNCTLTGNSSYAGGGASGSTLVGCTLNNNSAFSSAYGSAPYGGGADSSTLNNCVLAGNSAGEDGGGASSSTLNNCIITGCSATYAGSVVSSTLNNCTLVGNVGAGIYVGEGGGGADYSTLNNCIVYFNTSPAEPNYNDNTMTYCCTTPNPGGVGNITNAPLIVNWLVVISISNPIRRASTPVIMPMSPRQRPRWQSAHRGRDGGHRGLRISNARPQSFPTPGSSNTVCRPTGRRITRTPTATA